MRKENKVSLWLGNFESEEEFENYIYIDYDEDGDYIPSIFQKEFGISYYDEDFSELVWFSEKTKKFSTLLKDFSYSSQIIDLLKPMLGGVNIEEYNCVMLLYNYEHSNSDKDGVSKEHKVIFIGAGDVNYEV